jgi:hypothetical protein
MFCKGVNSMSHIATQHFSFSEIQQHPKQVVELLAQEQDMVILVKREGDDITICSYPAYSQAVNDILEEAKAEYQVKKEHGYTREQAFQDFRESQKDISKYL